MNTPLGTPVRQAKLGGGNSGGSSKLQPLASEYKKLFNEQHHRLWTKHQQDLDLIDDIRSYVKARLSIERDYTSALSKLAKQHSSHIAKKFTLLNQCDPVIRNHEPTAPAAAAAAAINDETVKSEPQLLHESEVSDSRLQKRLANNGLDEPDKPCSLYKVWSEHINRLQTTSKNRSEQFEQLIMVVDKLKDIRSHKASIGKKCLDTHLKRIHEDIVGSMVDVEKARKLYYEDESQAKKARENEEKIKKKLSGLLTKFTDLQAKKEKTSAQREANDIQSTQARNDYIMALAAGNAHLQHYFGRDLTDFIHTIDDGVLDHCKIFMATLSECDINSLKDALTHAQYWSKMINLTGSQKTNAIFIECDHSMCLRNSYDLAFEPCNNDPIQIISLEHNADYALQHEIDKWFTWFKKECRNLSQLMHQLEVCQRAFAEGKKSIELNGQTTEDLEPKIIELKQQIRKSEAAKLKAQARLKVIKEGGMQIEEWSAVESEIRADMARAQEELEAKRAKELVHENSTDTARRDGGSSRVDESTKNQPSSFMFDGQTGEQVQLQVSKDSDDSDAGDSVHNLASVSRSTSNLVQKPPNAMSGYSALTDPTLVWQDNYSGAWGGAQSNYNVVVTETNNRSPVSASKSAEDVETNRYDLLGTSTAKHSASQQQKQAASMTVQSSSPLSAIVDGVQSSPSPYQGMPGEAYKSDYECDYNINGHPVRSTASSAEPYNQHLQQQNHLQQQQLDPFGKPLNELTSEMANEKSDFDQSTEFEGDNEQVNVAEMLNRQVVAMYTFDKSNEDDLAFNENDILRVVEVSDPNWLRAVNEATGEEGYIPASYVRLLSEDNGIESDAQQQQDQMMTEVESNRLNSQDQETQERRQAENEPSFNESKCYCRALYDYEPEADTFEDDGLPHLALAQGELMRIIDQGEDDGWWLVEKETTSTRGHVPSMLVEELDFNENGDVDDFDEEEDDGDLSESYNNADMQGFEIKAMPTFEAPVLQEESTDMHDGSDESQQNQSSNVDKNNNTSKEDQKSGGGGSSSLIPTSFIIIEPTPECESRRVDDPIDNSQRDNSAKAVDDRPIVHDSASKPPNASYSVINEDFVLEGPTRKPYQHVDQVHHHDTPTILEENFTEETSEAQGANDISSKTPDGNYEPLSEVDSLEMPAPPSVIVESFEDDRQNKSPSLDDDNEDDRSSLDEQPVVYSQKEIKHTGNVDVNPLLRLRAEEFSKQIIAEAIMLAPGANVGPSTSSADVA